MQSMPKNSNMNNFSSLTIKTNRRAGKTKDDRVEEDDDVDNDEEEAESAPEFRFELNSPRIKNRRGKKAHLLGTSK
jgi:hypothetical protein